jgi:parallel beta-helix repeat protein
MKKKIVSAMTLVLLLTSMVTLAFHVQPVKAQGTIYIRADGSIDPPTAPISSLDNITYTFTDSIYDEIVVERNNIVIDGNGYTLQGTGAYASKGIDLSSRSNITSKNTNIKDFSYGILLSESSNICITGNNITNNSWGGIGLWGASNNTISGNHITNNSGIGIMLAGLFGSSNNRVIGNVLVDDGLSVWNSYGNVVVDNLVNGKPLVYLEGVSDVVVEDAGQVILVNCNRIKVENLNLSNTYIGVQLWQTNNATISGNQITNNSYGIRLDDSSNYNSISGNNITANNGQGVQLDYSSGNKVSGNNIANNGYGVYLFASSGNSIFHNNFANNTVQAYTYGSSANMWDDGYPSGGNYWSDYSGIDLYEGPYQNVTGSDGIGDTPYIINGYNQDNYPLMNQWVPPTHDIAVTNVSTSKSGCLPMPNVGQNQTVRVNISVENQGDFTETFNVTAYATNLVSTYAIGQQTVTLTAHTSTSITIVWNTLGFARSNYTLSAVADIVLGEADTADNTKVDGVIWVNLIGDVNCDDYVGIDDTFTIASHFAQDPSHPDWNTNCDLNDDDYVGIDDIFTAASHFGEENP